jgi:hypothetical protein
MSRKKAKTAEPAEVTEQPKVEDEPSQPTRQPRALTAPEGYELVDWYFGPRIYAGKYGTVDLLTLTPDRADSLVRRGFRHLRRRSD